MKKNRSWNTTQKKAPTCTLIQCPTNNSNIILLLNFIRILLFWFSTFRISESILNCVVLESRGGTSWTRCIKRREAMIFLRFTMWNWLWQHYTKNQRLCQKILSFSRFVTKKKRVCKARNKQGITQKHSLPFHLVIQNVTSYFLKHLPKKC